MDNKSPKKKNLTDQERDAYALVGRHGGRASFKKLGKKGMSRLGKKGAKARWAGTRSKKS
jgi:hypothetical protein